MFRRRSQPDPADEPDLLARSGLLAGPDAPSARDEVLEALRPWVAAQRRPAWRPVVAPGEPTAGARSQFCGRAWLAPGETAPTCTECGRPLRLFLQLDLGELPGELEGRFGDGVLQLLYCTGGVEGVDDGFPDCTQNDAWAPFSDTASLVRVVPGDRLMPPAAGSADEPGAPFGPSAIVGWEPFDDDPDPEDHEMAGLSSIYDNTLRTVSLRCPQIGLEATLGLDDVDVEDIARAADGDKLAGWPSWVQGAEYPACPTCGRAMRLVFQLDSEHNVPFMFGDVGIGHVTQCPTHHDTVAFAWAGS